MPDAAGLEKKTPISLSIARKIEPWLSPGLTTLEAMREVSPDIQTTLRDDLFDASWQPIAQVILGNLFDHALSLRGVTVWICATDSIAVEAIRYLGKHKRNDISVVGFDNSASSLEKGVSSYDFNHETIAFRMLDFIYGAKRKAGHFSQRPVEIEGTVIERESLRTAER